MHSNLEKKPRDQRRGGKKKPRRLSFPTSAPKNILEEVEMAADMTEKTTIQALGGFTESFFEREQSSGYNQTYGDQYSDMNHVICQSNDWLADWLKDENPPFTAHVSCSSSSQRFTEEFLTPNGYIERKQKFKLSRDISCPYEADFMFDVEDRADGPHGEQILEEEFEDEQNDVVSRIRNLNIGKSPNRRRAGAGFRDASEYKQSRRVRKR